MKIFKQKEYTIQEGHYTGPKDLPKIPGALEVIGKTTLGGATVGGVIGGVLKETGVADTSILSAAKTGGKTGFVAGIIAKYLLNALHKPMKTVKFQEVDKILRSKFGIYRVSGFTVGDSKEKRKSVEEKFSYNDRKIEDYRVSFVIQDNKVTMYTLGIKNDDLDKLNTSLDYFCKKFSGMDYTSKPIDAKKNSYSVSITFTNYMAISDFISEVSEGLGYKINLLNDGVLLENLKGEEEEKQFSGLDKYDRLRVLSGSAGRALGVVLTGGKEGWSGLAMKLIQDSIKTLGQQEASKYFPVRRKYLGTPYLEDRLAKGGFIEGHHYTKGLKNCECNIRLDRGLFMISVLKGSKADKLVTKIMEGKPNEIKGKVNLWTMYVDDKRKFDIILTKLIESGINPNIFIG